MRVLIAALGLTLLGAGACNGPWPLIGSSDDCVPNPGLCPPLPECVNGRRGGGSASCVNGEWVCDYVACTPDAGLDAGTD
jgi:hypothetical protein